MIEIKQRLIDFSTFLEENGKELAKADYAACIEDVYGQLTDIIDHQTEEPYDSDIEFYDDSIPDNEDD